MLILDNTAETFFKPDPAVKIIQEHLNFGITPAGNILTRKYRFWKDVRKLSYLLRKLNPSHVICTEYQFAIAALLGGAGKHSRIYSWEHHHYFSQRMSFFWRRLFKIYYPKLDAVVCLNSDEQQYYLELNPAAVVIPNFTETAPADATGFSAPNMHTLISVTRFNHIKGIDLLMKVSKSVLRNHPELRWKVIGYGDMKAAFIDFIREERLEKQILLQEATKTDLTADYRKAGIYVMTSRNECFPLVLLEAMSNGLPCISFDCDTGPRHIIEHEKTGILIAKEDVNEMAASILSLIHDPDRRAAMSQNALAAIRAFNPNTIYTLWEKLFEEYQ